MLPVFGFEEEAEMFLWLNTPGSGWKSRPTSCGELLSMLYGPCRRVDRVAPEPLPGTRDGDGLVSRKYFFARLLAP